jgi:hypothetical protein
MSRQGIPLDVLIKQENEIDAEIQRLTLKREMLRELHGFAVDFPTGNGKGAPDKILHVAVPFRPG